MMASPLYLFWSRAARASKWVDLEWRIALDRNGLGRIDPVPLESPDLAPPPSELAALHFNDWMLAYLRPRSSGPASLDRPLSTRGIHKLIQFVVAWIRSRQRPAAPGSGRIGQHLR